MDNIAEYTKLLAFACLGIPIVLMIFYRKEISADSTSLHEHYIFHPIFDGISLFSGSVLSIILILLPMNGSSTILFISLFLLLLSTLWIYHQNERIRNELNILNDMMTVGTKRSIFITVLIFFGILQLFAMMVVAHGILKPLLRNSFYLFIVLNIVIAGFIALVGDIKLKYLNNGIMGIVSVILLCVTFIFGIIVDIPSMNSIQTSDFLNSAVFSDNVPFSVGFVFLSLWLMWIGTGTFHQQNNDQIRREAKSIVIASLFLLVVVPVFFYFSRYSAAFHPTGNIASFGMPETMIIAFLVAFTLFFFSFLLRTFIVANRTMIHLIHSRVTNYTPNEKDILIGRLTIVALSTFSIFFLSFADDASSTVISYMIDYITYIIIPSVAIVILFILWKKFDSFGVMIGYYSGVVLGILFFIGKMIDRSQDIFIRFSTYEHAIILCCVTMLIGFMATQLKIHIDLRKKHHVDISTSLKQRSS